MDTYSVSISGLRSGFTKESVILRLAELFKTTEHEIKSQFEKSTFRVKKGVDFGVAAKYKAILEQHGCIVDITPDQQNQSQAQAAVDPSPSLQSSQSSVSSSAIAPEAVPTFSVTGGWHSYEVQFGISAYYKQNAPNCFSFYGKGTLDFDQNKIKISAKKHRLFWFGKRENIELKQADIQNARVLGKFVRFELRGNTNEKPRDVGFSVNDAQTAIEILQLLSPTQTEAFVRERAEVMEFKRRLDEISPNAPVTPILIALNVLVFILMALGGAGIWTTNAGVAINWGSNYGPLTLAGQWWRLITSTFIHFGILHLSFNMLALYQAGRMVERMFGSGRFLALYIFAGLSGSLLSLLWHPVINSAGASGAIFGVFGGLLVYMLNAKNEVPRSIMNEHVNSTALFIVYNLFNGFTHSGIDNGAHIGGLLGGMLMGYLLARPINVAVRAESVDKGQWLMAGSVGMIALTLLGFKVLNPSENIKQELTFTVSMAAFAPQEEKAVDETKRLFTSLKNADDKKVMDAANSLERDILPQWESLYSLISKARLSKDSERYQMQQTLLAYLDGRIKGYRLFIEGVRKNDSKLIQQAGDMVKESNKQIEAMKKLKKH